MTLAFPAVILYLNLAYPSLVFFTAFVSLVVPLRLGPLPKLLYFSYAADTTVRVQACHRAGEVSAASFR